MSGSYFCAIIDHDHLFLRQFLNPSKVEEYLQLVEKTQGINFRFCNLVLADRRSCFASWCLVYVDNETFLCLCAIMMSVIKNMISPDCGLENNTTLLNP